MRQPSYARQFEKDIQRMRKRGKDMTKIKEVIAKLVDEQLLAERYRDHILIGNYRGRRECHVEPDWLLIYKLQADELIFERTGTHADLFE